MLAVMIHNDGTGTTEVGNYDVQVLISGAFAPKTLWAGRVQGHIRSEGWKKLLEKILEAAS